MVQYVRGDRAAVRRYAGDYVLLEVLGESTLRPSSIVRGNLDDLGGTRLETETGAVDVFVQDLATREPLSAGSRRPVS